MTDLRNVLDQINWVVVALIGIVLGVVTAGFEEIQHQAITNFIGSIGISLNIDSSPIIDSLNAAWAYLGLLGSLTILAIVVGIALIPLMLIQSFQEALDDFINSILR